MGGTGSKAKVVSTAINDSVQSVVSKNYAGCSSQVYNAQVTSQMNVGITLFQKQKVTQTTSVSVSCMQDSRRAASLQTDLTNSIAQKVASESQAMLGALGPSTAEAISRMKNTIRASVTSENIVKSHSDIIQKQFTTQTFAGVSIGGSQVVQQGTSVVVQAVQSILETTDIAATLTNALEQDASAKQKNPMDFLADIFTSFAGIFIILIIVVGIVAVYFLRSGGLSMLSMQSQGLFSGQPGLIGRLGAQPYQQAPRAVPAPPLARQVPQTRQLSAREMRALQAEKTIQAVDAMRAEKTTTQAPQPPYQLSPPPYQPPAQPVQTNNPQTRYEPPVAQVATTVE